MNSRRRLESSAAKTAAGCAGRCRDRGLAGLRDQSSTSSRSFTVVSAIELGEKSGGAPAVMSRPPALLLAGAAPHSELLARVEGVLQARLSHDATGADGSLLM